MGYIAEYVTIMGGDGDEDAILASETIMRGVKEASNVVNTVTDDNAAVYVFAKAMFISEDIEDVAHYGDVIAAFNLQYNWKRGFFKNTGVDETIKYNGNNFTFRNAKVYCADIQEVSFFLGKSRASGGHLAPATAAEFTANHGNNNYFYW